MAKQDHIELYLERTRRSRELYEKARRLMPGGVSHRYRFIAPHPFFVEEARGSRIWDVDGNEYVDLWMGHFALILGHKSQVAQDALEEAARVGIHWGIVHEHQVRFAELIQQIVPCAEKVVFGVSGTEVTMYAVRLARGFTRRNTILKMEGGWHGANSELLWAVKPPYQDPESAGLVPGMERYVRAVPFNDLEGTLRIIHEVGDDLAGIIVEPLVGAGGFLAAQKPYLEMLREETRKRGAILIFDEIITGFRLSLKGAQGFYGIVPDLATLGKVVGGGTNLGVIAGRSDVMALCDPTIARPKGQAVVVGGGTFSCSPLSMIVGYRVVEHLKENQDSIYPAIDQKGQRVRASMVAALEERGICAKASGMGSLCGLYFPKAPSMTIRNPGDIQSFTDVELLDQEFRIRMMNHGVFVMHGGGAISTAHTHEDVQKIIQATQEVASEIASSR
ncbi:MAG: aminotransferase class III-fold pyridoxal phosphate-dependent enzyme [bacterium]